MTSFSHKKTFKVEVDVPPEKAYDCFLQFVWWGGGGLGAPKQIYKPEGAVEGSGRGVPGGIHEVILRADRGKSLEYTLQKNMMFPVSQHLGVVTFSEVGPSATQVVWTIYYTPLPLMNIICLLMLTSISLFLSHLKNKVENGSSIESKITNYRFPTKPTCFLLLAAGALSAIIWRK